MIKKNEKYKPDSKVQKNVCQLYEIFFQGVKKVWLKNFENFVDAYNNWGDPMDDLMTRFKHIQEI